MNKISPTRETSQTPLSSRSRHENEFERLIERVTDLRSDLLDCWAAVEAGFENYDEPARASARNLVHYLALRNNDIRRLQNDLARHGISSLGRAESHVMTNINKVLKLLHRIVQRPYIVPPECKNDLSLDEGNLILERHTDVLLGKRPENRKVRIMVTLPSEAADDYALVRNLIAGGMDCARINCAHDDSDEWGRMVDNIRRAEQETGRACKICIDLAGPKLRTGLLEDGPRVLKWRPQRDVFGGIVKPARIWLTPSKNPAPVPVSAAPKLNFARDFLSLLQIGDKIKFKDRRGARRVLKVTQIVGESRWAECRKTAYIGPQTRFKIVRKAKNAAKRFAGPDDIPPLKQFIPLRGGDFLIVTKAPVPGRPARLDLNGEVIEPARISCTLPEVFDYVAAGENIWFDDGKIHGIIKSVSRDEILVEIINAEFRTLKLQAEKGINLPDSDLRFPSLTAKDLADLKFIARRADLVGYSFVRSAGDVCELQDKLKELGNERLGIMLKIETRGGFEQLPEILLTAMRSHSVAVMIARGDLAVETGFERLAEVQEEILWMCEAAHVPVVWATQVLENLSRDGVYTRAEITDAAMSERAECVMLNKGLFVVEAVRALADILTRMGAHQDKKRPMLRRLRVADRFFDILKKKKIKIASDRKT